MPFVLPHQGRREGERAAAGGEKRGEREMEEEETERGERKKERRTRETRRGGGGGCIQLSDCMLYVRVKEWSCTWLICS